MTEQTTQIFHTIKDWKINSSCNIPIQESGCVTVMKEFTSEELEAIEVGAYVSDTWEVNIDEEITKKIEISNIEKALKKALPRYNELKELWEMRSENENTEFQAMETKKTQLMIRRKQILDNI